MSSPSQYLHRWTKGWEAWSAVNWWGPSPLTGKVLLVQPHCGWVGPEPPLWRQGELKWDCHTGRSPPAHLLAQGRSKVIELCFSPRVLEGSWEGSPGISAHSDHGQSV